MKIFKDYENEFYTKRNKLIGNCITIIEDNKEYYYEFNINSDTATIKYSDLSFIEEAADFYHSDNKYIYKYKTADDKFLKLYDKVFTFKLPISCLQPSKFFIDRERLEIIENNMDVDNICIPVAIINDEYVALDGHTRLYALLNNYNKLVDVYIDAFKPEVHDFIYIAKEQNILSIKGMQILNHEDYIKFYKAFLNDYYNIG